MRYQQSANHEVESKQSPENSNGAPPGRRTLADGIVQRQAKDGAAASAPGADTSAGAVDSVPTGGGVQLPDGLRSKFEGSLGTDLGGVRVHTGAESAGAAAALGARAFAFGQDIHFGAGEYTPGSRGGEALLAHEVAHTVQQRGAAPVPAGKAQVSTPGDAFELEADAAADRMVLGAPAQVSAGASGVARMMRKENVNANVGADPGIGGPTEAMPIHGNQEIHAGEAGYSGALLKQSASEAVELADEGKQLSILHMTPDELQLHQVAPDFSAIEKGRTYLQNQIEKNKKISGEGMFGSHMYWQKQQAGEAIPILEGKLRQLISDRTTEEQQFTGFNAWVPQANAVWGSMTRLQGQMNALGIGHNVSAMVAGLTRELGHASDSGAGVAATGAGAVGERIRDLYNAGSRDASEHLAEPSQGHDVTTSAMEATMAHKAMQADFLGFQQHMLELDKEKKNHEADGARERMGEIEKTKAFIKQVGSAIDTTAAVVNGAPAAIANATEKVNMMGATINAGRNKRAIMAGKPARWNPTYTTTNKDGAIIVRNVQTKTDLDVSKKPGEDGRNTSYEQDGGFTLPTSIGGAMNAIADFYFASEVNSLRAKIYAVETHCAQISQVSGALKLKEQATKYRVSVETYATKAYALQKQVAQRREEYLKLGEQLDRVARDDAKLKGAGLAPAPAGKKPGERYATVMLLTSSVREVVALARAAMSSRTDCTPREILEFFNGTIGWRGDGRDYAGFGVGETEFKRIKRMYNQSAEFGKHVEDVVDLLGPVDVAAQNLLRGLSQGGGSGDY